MMMYFYVDDTTGLNLPAAVAINEPGITPLQVEIFPNPASEMLYIKSLLNLSGATISLTDMSGKIVRTQLTESISTQSNYYQVNINDLSSGIYLINLTDVQGNVASEKIVIQ